MRWSIPNRTNRRKRLRGSVALEAAIVMPIVLLLLVLQVRLIQCVCLQNCLERAADRTALLMSRYAILYHEYGVGNVENRVLSEVGSYFDNASEKRDTFLRYVLDLRACAERGDDVLYTAAATKILQYYLRQDALVAGGYVEISDVSLQGSAFFNDGEDIELRVSCRAYGLFRIGTSMRVRAWIRGDRPIAALTESGVSVWTLNNFARGKVLRSIFGANLAYDYPVIAAFEDGEAKMIKSLDFTAKTYQIPQNFRRELEDMLEKLRAFQGTADMPGVEPDEQIAPEEIRRKTLLLIIPTNTMSPEQAEILLQISGLAGAYSIRMEIIAYHEAPAP